MYERGQRLAIDDIAPFAADRPNDTEGIDVNDQGFHAVHKMNVNGTLGV
jgi:hypothetical protein